MEELIISLSLLFNQTASISSDPEDEFPDFVENF